MGLFLIYRVPRPRFAFNFVPGLRRGWEARAVILRKGDIHFIKRACVGRSRRAREKEEWKEQGNEGPRGEDGNATGKNLSAFGNPSPSLPFPAS